MILDALQSVLTIFIMVALGVVLTKKGWFDENTGKLFSKIVTKVSLPAFMIVNLTSSFTKDVLTTSSLGIGLAFLNMIICYGIGHVLGGILKVDKRKRGLFSVMFGLSNTIFIGLPVNTALFGGESTQFVLLYYITNTLFFWTLGVYGIKKDSGQVSANIFSLDSLKNIITPPIVTFIISVILILLDIRLPKFFLSACSYVGSLTTPLSIFFMGITLTRLDKKSISFNRETVAVILGRFLLAPVVMFLIIGGFGFPVLMKKVFILEAAMPVMTQSAIVTEAYGGDYKEATVLCTLTTALSLIFIPIYMILFNYL
ncbi:AEC family transporter [Clostridium sp. UBA4548]|uniref:AEC family transporter n=1 Tax=Clostridium sp. UBA4548 TaxID=1946361 RepID=UPI0025B87E8C|nr:AEC family transporter [Clostridium sp. UBA4548]